MFVPFNNISLLNLEDFGRQSHIHNGSHYTGSIFKTEIKNLD